MERDEETPDDYADNYGSVEDYEMEQSRFQICQYQLFHPGCTACCGGIELGSYCYDFGYRVFTESPVDETPGRDVTVSVTADMSEHDIGKMLKEEGLVEDANLFYAQLKLSAYSGKLKPGVYTLNTSMTAREMFVIMAADAGDTESTEDTEDTADTGNTGAADLTDETDDTQTAEDAGDAEETP